MCTVLSWRWVYNCFIGMITFFVFVTHHVWRILWVLCHFLEILRRRSVPLQQENLFSIMLSNVIYIQSSHENFCLSVIYFSTKKQGIQLKLLKTTFDPIVNQWKLRNTSSTLEITPFPYISRESLSRHV